MKINDGYEDFETRMQLVNKLHDAFQMLSEHHDQNIDTRKKVTGDRVKVWNNFTLTDTKGKNVKINFVIPYYIVTKHHQQRYLALPFARVKQDLEIVNPVTSEFFYVSSANVKLVSKSRFKKIKK